MKLLMENWRKYLKEEKWEDARYPKGTWTKLDPADIKNAKDPENIDLSDELFHLIDTAYKGIGGHFDYKSADDVPDDADFWLAVDLDDDPEPDALRIGKTKPAGLKLSASGHDGSRAGKDAYVGKTAELLASPGHYAEMSKAIAHMMLTRYEVPVITDPETVQRVLGPSKPIEWLGPHPKGKYPGIDGWYTRALGGGDAEMKIMLGNPK